MSNYVVEIVLKVKVNIDLFFCICFDNTKPVPVIIWLNTLQYIFAEIIELNLCQFWLGFN